MNKTISFSLVVFVSIILEIGVFSRFAFSWNLSLLVPLIFISTLVFGFEEALVLSLASGFILDISTLQRIPFWSIFLVLEVVLITLSQKKIIDFRHALPIALGMFAVTVLRLGLQGALFHENILSLESLYGLLVNFLICLVVLGLWILIKQKWGYFADEKGSKRI